MNTELTMIDKAKGVILGLAIGDALGAPTEFIKLPEIKRRYGPQGISDLPDPTLFTDDTQMSIAVAEALIKAGEKDIDVIMEAVREEFIKWLHSPENKRAPGRTCLQGVANMEKGTPWTKSGIERSKGCGSAMRSAPIGYLYQHDPVKLKEVAHATGICTHGHPTADAACIGAAYLVKLALDGTKPENMIPELLRFTSGISGEFDEAIQKVARCIEHDSGISDSPSPRLADSPIPAISPVPPFADSPIPPVLGEGWIGEEAVALALYCFLRYPDDYKRAVLRGANSNGDSDSIASIAGSISGAYLGISAIPATWVRDIEKSLYLTELSDRLFTVKRRLPRAGQ